METAVPQIVHNGSDEELDKHGIMRNFSNSSFSGVLLLEESRNDIVKIILDYLLLVILIIIMLAMGCEISLTNVILLIIHFGSYKASNRLINWTRLPVSLEAFVRFWSSEVITNRRSACYWCLNNCLLSRWSFLEYIYSDGDLDLSVAMTTLSTVMAMGLMPMNLWLYGRSFETESLVIPYKQMALSIISVTSPIIAGVIIKWKLPSVAKWVAKIGNFGGLGIMFICFIIEIVVFPNMFSDVPLILYSLVFALPLIGLGVGYLFSLLGNQNMQVRKTVTIECGVQNVPLALTCIALSFPIEMQADIVLLPWLYGLVMISSCTVICLVYNYFKKQNEQLPGIKKINSVLKENGDLVVKDDVI